MPVTRDQELWAIALRVERDHGDSGSAFIEQQIAAFEIAGQQGGVELWRSVAERHARLTLDPTHPN